jgi:hypothetical protein
MMSKIVNDPHPAACSHLFSKSQIHKSQGLSPDLFLARARDGISRLAALTRNSAAFLLLTRLRSSG